MHRWTSSKTRTCTQGSPAIANSRIRNCTVKTEWLQLFEYAQSSIKASENVNQVFKGHCCQNGGSCNNWTDLKTN